MLSCDVIHHYLESGGTTKSRKYQNTSHLLLAAQFV